MYSSDNMVSEFLGMFEGWYPIKVDLNDNIETVRLNHIDEAYEIMLDYEEPKFYSIERVNDNGKIYIEFRYQK